MGKQTKKYLLLLGLSALLLSGCAGNKDDSAPVEGPPAEAESVMDSKESEALEPSGDAEADNTIESGAATEADIDGKSDANMEADADGKSDAGMESDATTEPAESSDLAETVSFECQDMEGNAVSADVFSESKLTMVNVWATYCGPCLNEMPALGELAGEYDPADFQLIGIISDVLETADEETLATAAELITETGADYPHLLLNESLYYALLTDVSAVPTTFFINQEGEILQTVIGSQDKAAWEETIHALLEEL